MPGPSSQTQKLRSKIKKTLCTPVCNMIRFELDNVSIRYLHYNYVAGLIERDKIHINVSDGHSYDHDTDIITFDGENVAPNVIVHEATHAVIDAVNPGLTITKATGELCAYLAETIYAHLTTGSSVDLEYD